MEIAQRVGSSKPKPPKEENRLEKFLKFDNCCLKFDAYWDDRDSQSGDIHYLVVYYYLSDDTIQITEVRKNEKPVTLYRRLKLPKVSRSNDAHPMDELIMICYYLFELENRRCVYGISKVEFNCIECTWP